MTCPNNSEGVRKVVGVCHVCAMRDRLPVILQVFIGEKGRQKQEVTFCGGCCHWFCQDCKKNVMGRLTGFLEAHVKGAPDGCCGPEEKL